MLQDNEYVLDSENEDELGMNRDAKERSLSQLSMDLELRASRAKAIEETSYISTFSTGNTQAGPSNAGLSINQFTSPPRGALTNKSSISAATSPFLKAPRPRPRPKKKPALTDDIASGVSSIVGTSFMDHITNPNPTIMQPQLIQDFEMPGLLSIADRAKTRQRKATATQAVEDFFDEAIEPEPSTGSSKGKSKSKSASDKTSSAKKSNAKGKAKETVPIFSGEVIELTDDSEDELNIWSKKKPAMKPREKQINLVPSSDFAELPIQRPRPRPRPTGKKPAEPTSSTPPVPPFDSELPSHEVARNSFIPSSLPPSDFPPSTANPLHEDIDVPQIETLPNVPSSSSSKRRSEIDELFSGDDDDFFLPPPYPRDGSPPPTFFAGSSSFPTNEPVDNQQVAADQPTSEVVDLTTFPTLPPSPRMGITIVDQPLKPKKKSKKAKDDEGWDPTVGDEPVSKKKKAAPKKKKGMQVEVVIALRTPGNAGGEGSEGQAETSMAVESSNKEKKKKGKAKDKDETSSGKKKKGKAQETEEVYKSKEFIEDSDEEDPLLHPGVEINLPVASSSSTAHGISTTSAAGTNAEDIGPGAGYLLPDAPPSPLSDLDVDMDVPESSKPKPSKKRKSKGIEDEEEDFLDALQGEDSPSKRRKTAKPADKKDKGKKTKKGKGNSKDVEDSASIIINQEPELPEEDVPQPRIDKGKGKRGVVVLDEEDDGELDSGKKDGSAKQPQTSQITSKVKENVQPGSTKPPMQTPNAHANTMSKPSLHKRYSIASRISTPMTELIKRVNSLPNSPFPVASSARISGIPKTATAYSPYLKSSKSALSRIAPLHPNRRTPPPPLPPPPPKKKTKKELEREEKWEEELIDSLGGIEVWAAMSDAERRDLRKAKFNAEMGDWD